MASSSELPAESIEPSADHDMKTAIAASGKHLLEFSNLLRALTTDNTQKEGLIELRQAIVHDLGVYSAVHLPATERFTSDLQCFMDNYVDVPFDVFAECIHEIAEEARGHAVQAAMVRDMHRAMRSLVQDREEHIADVKSKHALTKRHANKQALLKLADAMSKEQRYKEIEVQANGVRAWSWAVAVPTVGLSLLGLVMAEAHDKEAGALKEKSEESRREAEANMQRAKNAEAFLKEVSEKVQPVVLQLVEGVSHACLYFADLSNEVQLYSDMAGEGAATAKLKLHYYKMKSKAKGISDSCRLFKSMLPQVQDNFARIQQNSSPDEDYIQAWLNNKEDILQLQKAGGERASLFQKWVPFDVTTQGAYIWIRVRMDNRYGAGTIKQEVTLKQMIQTAYGWSESVTNSKSKEHGGSVEANASFQIQGLLSVGGKGMKEVKEALAALQQHGEHARQQHDQGTETKVMLEAERGLGAIYTVTMNIANGSFGGLSLTSECIPDNDAPHTRVQHLANAALSHVDAQFKSLGAAVRSALPLP